MRTTLPKQTPPTRSHRPRAVTVFAAAFVAGAAAAVGVNRTLDVRMAQSKPRVESEAIFVALRSLPQGAPVTVWDVALRDWPKAMMPTTALRASDTFSGHVLKHPLREGQPLLSIQLAPFGQGVQPAADPTAFPPPAAYTQSSTPVVPTAEGDLWSPAAPVETLAHPPLQQSVPQSVSQAAPPSPLEPVDSVAAADHSPTDSTAATTGSPTTPEVTTPADSSQPAKTGVTPVVEDVATVSLAPADQPTSEPATPPDTTPDTTPGLTAAEPAVTASSDVAPPVATAETGNIPEPFAALPSPPASPTPIPVPAPTAPAPVERPRPVYSRYLVVPESIAVQADASFASRAAAPQQPAEAPPSLAPQTASRPASNAVRPLPSTTAADRAAQSKPHGNSTQGRSPQRQGRQAQPAAPGVAPGTPPQPRLGAAMFPNLSAGLEAIEGRIRGEQPAQGQAPAAAQGRPITAR